MRLAIQSLQLASCAGSIGDRVARVMQPNRFKATVVLSSDHAGLSAELVRLEAELIKVLSRVDDARKLRDYIHAMIVWSQTWCASNGVDMRAWTNNGRYRKA